MSAEIGMTFDFLGYEVVIIQEWRDPFGRKMIRIRTTKLADEIEDGMPEDEFLAKATPAGRPAAPDLP